ncbi:MAG: IS200/IS605 family transposase [Flavisolibacter sp.]
MSFIKIWIHFVWSTKYRKPILIEPYRSLLFQHIKQHAFEKNIFLDRINGYEEHVHAIVSLGPNQTIDGIAQILKGESSFWFNNKSGFKMPKLSWQGEYFAASVSESALPVLRAYVDRQVIHHQKKSFQKEYNDLMKKYGFESLG